MLSRWYIHNRISMWWDTAYTVFENGANHLLTYINSGCNKMWCCCLKSFSNSPRTHSSNELVNETWSFSLQSHKSHKTGKDRCLIGSRCKLKSSDNFQKYSTALHVTTTRLWNLDPVQVSFKSGPEWGRAQAGKSGVDEENTKGA